MHLSLPKGIDAGSKEKLEELLVEEVLITPKTYADGTTKPPAKQPVIFDPGTLIETFPHEQGKEIIVADTIIPRYASLLNPNAKWLEFEHIRRLYNSNDEFKNVFPFCEKFEHKKFFRHGGFLFDRDKLCEPSLSLLNSVLMSIDKFTRAADDSKFIELFFGEVVYYDSLLSYNKNLDNPVEQENYAALSKKLLASKLDYVYHTYDRLSRDFVVSTQDVPDGELIFHAPKTWLFHVWLKKIVAQADCELLEYAREEQQANQHQCRMIFDPGGNLRTQMERGHFPAHTRTNAYQLDLQGKYTVSSSFKVTDLVSLFAGKTDLRTNPFQVGEDDVIMASRRTKETKEQEEQLEPERKEAKEQLVAEEIQEQEPEAAHIPFGSFFKPKAKEPSQYSTLFNTKTRATLSLLIQPPWLRYKQLKGSSREVLWLALFFPWLGFVPLGFPTKVFNEACPQYYYQSPLFET